MACSNSSCFCNSRCRTCINVDKVFDACIRQEALSEVLVTVLETVPPDVVAPFTFVSAKSLDAAIVENLVVTPLGDTCGNSRVQCDVVIPMEITFTDSNSVSAIGLGTITIPYDICMKVPDDAIVPYRIEATAKVVVTDGTYVSGSQFSLECCATVVLRVLARVDLQVQSCGYCQIPACVPYAENACDDIFSLPLFP